MLVDERISLAEKMAHVHQRNPLCQAVGSTREKQGKTKTKL